MPYSDKRVATAATRKNKTNFEFSSRFVLFLVGAAGRTLLRCRCAGLSPEPSVLVLAAAIRKNKGAIAPLFLVPLVGLEPTRRMSPPDFESGASASFTTAAFYSARFCCIFRVFLLKYYRNGNNSFGNRFYRKIIT